MITIKVDDKQYDDFPKLVSFPLGPPADNCLSINVEQKGTGKKRKRNIIGNLNGVQYVGHDYGDNNWKNNLNSYAVGMLDETTNIMTIVPADHIFVMRPNFPDKAIKSTVTSRIDNYAERRQSLTDEFGSKKKQRALKAAQSNTILAENISGADTVERLITKSAEKEKSSTNNTTGGINDTENNEDNNNDNDNDGKNSFQNIALSTEQAVEENRSKVLPPYNENATELEDAYPTEWMMPKTLRKSLIDYHDLVCNPTSTNILSPNSSSDIKPAKSAAVSRFESLYAQSLSTCHAESQKLIKNMATSWELFFHNNRSSTSYMLHLFHYHLQDTVVNGEKLHKKPAQIVKGKEKTCQLIFLQFCIRLFLLLSGTDGTADASLGDRSRIVTQVEIEQTLSLIPGFTVPVPVVKFMMDNFTTFKKVQGSPGCVMDKLKRDKLLLHIIVLSLNLGDYVADLTELGAELKLQTEKLVTLALQTGCTINKPRSNQASSSAENSKSGNGSSTTAHLVVPLKFPMKRAPIKAKKGMN